MEVYLLIASASDDSISFGDYNFSHVGCAETMRQHRNPVTSQYTLRCPCGLAITLDQAGDAANLISNAFISDEEILLPKEMFDSEQATAVLVSKANET